MNKRPYIICLMMSSVDGKILGDKWGNHPYVKALLESFEETHEAIGNKSWIVGRTTMEKDFTKFAKPIFKEVDYKISRETLLRSITQILLLLPSMVAAS